MPYLKPAQWTQHLRGNSLKDIYIIAGEERFLVEKSLAQMEKLIVADELNREQFYGDEVSANDLMLGLQTLPFMNSKRLILVRDAQRIRKCEFEKLAECLRATFASSCLILVWNEKIRPETRRNPLFKIVDEIGIIIEFKAVYESDLPAWIQEEFVKREKKIASDAIRSLVQESGSNLTDLNNEIEKIDLFTGARKEISASDVEGVSGHTRLANLNNLSEAIEEKDRGRAFTIIENLIREGEIPLRIIATAYRVVRRLALAKSMRDERKSSSQEIRQELNLNPYFDRRFFEHLSRFSQLQLTNGLERILQADYELKTSARPDIMILEELVLTLCRE